jgi:hypothetical protein
VTGLKHKLKKIVQFILNPRLLLCYGLAWMITNGWSYVLLVLGMWLDIGWMIAVGTAYLAFLWLPVSPEKIVTFAITIALLRWLFPNDQKTLAVMKDSYARLKAAISRKRQERKQKKKEKQQGR